MSSIENIVIDIQTGKNAKNELYTAIYKLLYKLCAKYLQYAVSLGWESDDLLSMAWFGVEKAVQDFSPDKEYKFITYLTYHINNSLREFLGNKNTEKVHSILSLDREVCGTDGLTYGETIEDETASDAFDEAEKTDYFNCLYKTLQTLPPEENEVLKSYFWNGETLQHIAANLNKNCSAIVQCKNKGLRRLRNNPKIKECYYEDFAYRYISQSAFNSTWTSSTEWAAIKVMELKAD